MEENKLGINLTSLPATNVSNLSAINYFDFSSKILDKIIYNFDRKKFSRKNKFYK